jgi:hypothetical protein
MKKRWQEMQRPHRRDDAALVRAGRHGMYWQSGDGLVVRLAAPDVEAAAVASAPPAAPHPRPVRREAPGVVGPAGLALALWMRMFGQVA